MKLSKTLNSSDRKYLIKKIKHIEENTRFTEAKEHIQHGDTSVYMPSLAVAYVSLVIIGLLGLRKISLAGLLVGALLHDYFLYDWHVDSPYSLHGFRHPGRALENAKRDYEIGRIEENVIKRHMFPLTPTPPTTREGIVVCIADKICSTYEVFARNTYPKMRKELKVQ